MKNQHYMSRIPEEGSVAHVHRGVRTARLELVVILCLVVNKINGILLLHFVNF